MFCKARVLVFCWPDTLSYSQDYLMGKKKAPMKSSHRAKSMGEIADLYNCFRVDPVTANC
jgi:hypothetical protein